MIPPVVDFLIRCANLAPLPHISASLGAPPVRGRGRYRGRKAKRGTLGRKCALYVRLPRVKARGAEFRRMRAGLGKILFDLPWLARRRTWVWLGGFGGYYDRG